MNLMNCFGHKSIKEKMTIEELREERLSLTIEYFDLKVDENYLTGFFKKFLNRLFELIEPDEQLIQNLKNLSKNYKLALLSNGGHVEQREKLRRSQVENYFRFTSGETGYLKPDARAFKNVLTKENFQASETLMVGDLIEHDIKTRPRVGNEDSIYWT
ncbi:HAD family hydrolase [Lactococcus lactis]|uniref:HAD family hydrolase n=1 Tax=Lactococcus lactis TaxID=1358 RepID=UPI003C6ECE56